MRKDSKVEYRAIENNNNNIYEVNRVIPAEQLDDFKHIVENNIIKYIALGFSKAVKEKEQPKPLYDKGLGLVSEGQKPEEKGNVVTKGYGQMKKNIKEFFEFN